MCFGVPSANEHINFLKRKKRKEKNTKLFLPQRSALSEFLPVGLCKQQNWKKIENCLSSFSISFFSFSICLGDVYRTTHNPRLSAYKQGKYVFDVLHATNTQSVVPGIFFFSPIPNAPSHIESFSARIIAAVSISSHRNIATFTIQIFNALHL